MRAKCLSHEHNLGHWSALRVDICYIPVTLIYIIQCCMFLVAKLAIIIIILHMRTSFSEKGSWTSVSRSTLTGGSLATFSVD